MAATTPRESFLSSSRGYGSSSADDHNDDHVKIPKRGSSRGSSCTEDVIHQTMMNEFGDLFPTQYKNASNDTILRISKITTSSSNSNSGSPELA